MNECDSITLQKIIFDVIKQESKFAGAPLLIVIRKMNDRIIEDDLNCTEQDIVSVIQSALDEWLLDKTIAYLPEKREIELGA